MSMPIQQIDKRRIARKFGSAAATYNKFARVQLQAGLNLIRWLSAYQDSQLKDLIGHPRKWRVLDLGCGTGALVPYFLQCCNTKSILGIDFSEKMLEVARQSIADDRVVFRCTDFESLASIKLEEFELLFSNFSMQWALSLESTVQHLYEYSKPGALFALTIPGVATFSELAQAWCRVDGVKRVNRFFSLEDWSSILADAGFSVIHEKTKKIVELYDTVEEALMSVRQSGVTSALNDRRKPLLGKTLYQQFLDAYRDQVIDVEGHRKVPLTYQINYIVGRRD